MVSDDERAGLQRGGGVGTVRFLMKKSLIIYSAGRWRGCAALTLSFCPKRGVQCGKATGTEHRENGEPCAYVFNNLGIHNEPDIHRADKSRFTLYGIV
jgi:hypothetical protein